MRLDLTGWSALTSAGIGRDAFAAVVGADPSVSHPTPRVDGLYDEALPGPIAHALVNLDVRQILGRKGTSSLDRRTALALIACRDALSDGKVRVDAATRDRIGVALGTTWGSLKAMSDYTKESLLEERPYLVEPARFPNTVMNCASGQAAIWFGLKGVNATIAGGRIAFFNVLEYTANLLRCGYADTILAGAVEEFTPHNAWATHLLQGGRSAVPAGEAAVVFVVERPGAARAEGRPAAGEVLSCVIAFVPGAKTTEALSAGLCRCIRRALAKASVGPDDVTVVATMETGEESADRVEIDALGSVWNGSMPERIAPKKLFGECQSASGALQVGAVLARDGGASGRHRRIALVTGWTEDGGVAAAVVRA